MWIIVIVFPQVNFKTYKFSNSRQSETKQAVKESPAKTPFVDETVQEEDKPIEDATEKSKSTEDDLNDSTLTQFDVL